MRSVNVYKLILLTTVVALLLPNLGTIGIFGDGLIYAVVSRNLALGLGSWWSLYYSDAIFAPFAEHPPLMFWLESFWFRLLGDHTWTEKSFSLVLGLLMAASLRHFWVNMPDRKETANYWWLPVFLWIIVPTIHWAYPNNMLENMLVLFTSWAIWKVVRADDNKTTLWVGGLVFLAFMTKGLVGLFPLAAFGIKAISLKTVSLQKAAQQTILATFCFVVLFGFTLLYEPARASWTNYFNTQLFATFSGERAVQDHIENLPRYYILLRVFTELFNPLLILGGLYFIARRKIVTVQATVNKEWVRFFLLVALSATLPLLFSPKQHSFYLIPAIPWFIFALTLWTQNWLFPLFGLWSPNHWTYQFCRFTFVLLLIAALLISVYRFGKAGRDATLIADVEKMAAVKSATDQIALPAYLIRHHSLHAYFQRNHSISLYINDQQSRYWISEKDSLAPDGYQPTSLKLNHYVLSEKKH